MLGEMQKLLRDQCGAVAPFLAGTIFLLVGIGALAVELPRMANFTTDLQNAADAAALAGAAELSGLNGSINRATCAAINTFTNSQKFGSGSSNITLGDSSCNTAANITIDFLNALPSSDSTAIPNSDTTTSDSDARFIRVTIANQGINFAFASIFGVSSATAQVSAVAGNDTEVCQTPPMFVCNPTEPPGNTNTSLNVDYTQIGGVSIRAFYAGGNKSQYSPGNFGLLCPAGGTKCNPTSLQMSKMFAAPQGTCVRTQNSQILTKPGVDQNSVQDGLNVRLDDWSTGARKLSSGNPFTDPSLAPAYDVTQGRSVGKNDYKGNGTCPNGGGSNAFSMPTSGTSEPLMPDTCLLSNTCTGINGNTNIGNGTWDRTTYFNVNHDGNTASATLGASPSPYQVYRWEVQTASNVVAPGDAIPGGSTTTEDGLSNPVTSPSSGYACYQGGTTADTYNYSTLSKIPGTASGQGSLSFQALADRRLMPLAIENCIANGLAGGSQNITPVEWDYAFIIGPMADPFYSQTYNNNNSAIFLQLLGKMSQTDLSQAVHNVVRLYRR